ncbi:MAG TPA: tRNA pseudouridine(38-40) synthase TruA [Chlamydiales bacterium]
MNYKLLIAYDGTRYFGWQKTRSGPSIQEELEQAATTVLQKITSCEAASRTDRGVHARGQVVQVISPTERAPERLLAGMNANLPLDIRVVEASIVDETFHPTLNATSKTYTYHLCLSLAQNPFHRRFSWHYPHEIDLDALRQAAKLLAGTHDFSPFSTEPKPDSVRTLLNIDFSFPEKERLCITLTADRFLYKMARTLAGTLAYIGSGKLSPDIPEKLFSSLDRTLAGITAPPHGLCLDKVHY